MLSSVRICHPQGTQKPADLLTALHEAGLQKPYLSSTEEGGIQAECSFPESEVEVEFSPGFKKALGHGVLLRYPAHAFIDMGTLSDSQIKKASHLLSETL